MANAYPEDIPMPLPPIEKVFCKVPFREKELAKRNGAKWDGKKKIWWFPKEKVTDFVKGKWEIVETKKHIPVSSPVAKDGTGKMTGWFDGGSRGNPGICGYGAVLRGGNGKMFGVKMGGCTRGTNNEAEYNGLICLLDLIQERLRNHPPDPTVVITIRGDSQLVINQVQGVWKCQSENLLELHKKASALLEEISNDSGVEDVVLEHVMRVHNGEADNLANLSMDRLM